MKKIQKKANFESINYLMRGVFVVVLFGLFSVSGCGSDSPPDVTIDGQLTTSGNETIPANSSAHVSLVQHGKEDGENRIVAERSIHNLGRKPISFELTVGRGLIHSNGYYGLSAQILDKSGTVRWATPVAQEINPLHSKGSVSLMLQAMGVRARDSFKRYRCSDGFQFAAETSRSQATLRLGNRQLGLAAATDAPATSPKKYGDDHGNRLQTAAGTGTLRLDGHGHDLCRQVVANNAADSRHVPQNSAASAGQPDAPASPQNPSPAANDKKMDQRAPPQDNDKVGKNDQG